MENENKRRLKQPKCRKCSECGLLYWTTDRDFYLCPACAKNIKSNSVIRTRTCAMCGAEFQGYPRSKYCPQCKPQVNRQQASARRKRTPRKIGSEDICVNCGKSYIVASGLQKYCPECAKVVVPDTVRKHKREYMKSKASEFNAAREEKRSRRHACAICVICGKAIIGRNAGAKTCSEECARTLRKQALRRADKKRSPRKRGNDEKSN